VYLAHPFDLSMYIYSVCPIFLCVSSDKFLLDLSTCTQPAKWKNFIRSFYMYLARPFDLSTYTYPVRPIFLRVPSQPARWQIFIGSFYVYLARHVTIFYLNLSTFTQPTCRIANFYWIFPSVPSLSVRSIYVYLSSPPDLLCVPSQPAGWQIFIGSF
jgi:hypothetical protein